MNHNGTAIIAKQCCADIATTTTIYVLVSKKNHRHADHAGFVDGTERIGIAHIVSTRPVVDARVSGQAAFAKKDWTRRRPSFTALGLLNHHPSVRLVLLFNTNASPLRML